MVRQGSDAPHNIPTRQDPCQYYMAGEVTHRKVTKGKEIKEKNDRKGGSKEDMEERKEGKKNK